MIFLQVASFGTLAPLLCMARYSRMNYCLSMARRTATARRRDPTSKSFSTATIPANTGHKVTAAKNMAKNFQEYGPYAGYVTDTPTYAHRRPPRQNPALGQYANTHRARTGFSLYVERTDAQNAVRRPGALVALHIIGVLCCPMPLRASSRGCGSAHPPAFPPHLLNIIPSRALHRTITEPYRLYRL